MQPNPASGFEPNNSTQFFFENQRIMQLGVVDDNGHRLLENSDQTGLSDANLVMSFKQKLVVEDYFFPGQTFCANYNGNVDDVDKNWTDLKYDHE
mmetsp:Transcript_43757/g.58040  ORF Transcript_43757/g.58040 Transcript_43757/m.58040 type:complete len:95 (+) Transcript_43757:2080-2364(+)